MLHLQFICLGWWNLYTGSCTKRCKAFERKWRILHGSFSNQNFSTVHWLLSMIFLQIDMLAVTGRSFYPNFRVIYTYRQIRPFLYRLNMFSMYSHGIVYTWRQKDPRVAFTKMVILTVRVNWPLFVSRRQVYSVNNHWLSSHASIKDTIGNMETSAQVKALVLKSLI